MAKYRMLTGPFEGEVVEEGHTFISHLGFGELDNDMQLRVREFGEDKYFPDPDDKHHSESDFPVSLNELVEEYENSWQSVEIPEDIKITAIRKVNAKQNVQGQDEWWIHVGKNYAGSIYQARQSKGICVCPNESTGVNSALHKWWTDELSLQVAISFVRSNFSAYTPVACQAHLNETHDLDSLS